MSTALSIDFPELSHLSREDLEDLLADPNYFQAVFHSMRYVKDLYQSQAELGSANETLANNNLKLRDDLYQTRQETQDAFNEAKALEMRWRDLDREQRELYQRYSPAFLLMRLKHAVTAQDDLSEARATAFVQGASAEGTTDGLVGRDVDEFVKQFKEMRRVYHKRAMWVERWQANEVTWPDDR